MMSHQKINSLYTLTINTMKTNFLLLSKKTMSIIAISLLVTFSSCSGDPNPEPEPLPKPFVEGLNFKSVIAKDTKIETIGFKVSKTENLEAIFTLLSSDKTQKDTTVIRTGMKASAEVILPEQIAPVKERTTLGTLSIKKISRKVGTTSGDIVPINGEYEITGFTNDMKITIKTLTDSSFVKAYGKSVGISYNSELVPVAIDYKDEEGVIQEGVVLIDGIEFVNVKYFLNVKFKDGGGNEKILPVEVMIPFNLDIIDPEVGKRLVEYKNLSQSGTSYKSMIYVTIFRKSGREDVYQKEPLLSFGHTGEANKEISLMNKYLTQIGAPSVETLKTSVIQGDATIHRTTINSSFAFTGGVVSKISTYSEVGEVEIKGIKYKTPEITVTTELKDIKSSVTSLYPAIGCITREYKLNLLSASLLGNINTENKIYVKSPKLNVAEMNAKKSIATLSYFDQNIRSVTVAIFGTPTVGGGMVIYQGEKKEAFIPWSEIGDISSAAIITVCKKDGKWALISASVEGSNIVGFSLMRDTYAQLIYQQEANYPLELADASISAVDASNDIYRVLYNGNNVTYSITIDGI